MIRIVAIVALIALAPAFGRSTQWHTRGKTLRGDINGDGTAEGVVVEQRGHRCEFRLVAGSSTPQVRLAICRQKPSELIHGPDPHVAALVDVDRQPGVEVVVQIGHGAYMEFADVWTYRDGALRRYAGREPHLSYGSSVGTGAHVVGCGARAGVILVGDRSYPPHGRIVRRWYRARDLGLRVIRTKTIEWKSEQVPPFPEFRAPQPFPGCAKAR